MLTTESHSQDASSHFNWWACLRCASDKSVLNFKELLCAANRLGLCNVRISVQVDQTKSGVTCRTTEYYSFFISIWKSLALKHETLAGLHIGMKEIQLSNVENWLPTIRKWLTYISRYYWLVIFVLHCLKLLPSINIHCQLHVQFEFLNKATHTIENLMLPLQEPFCRKYIMRIMIQQHGITTQLVEKSPWLSFAIGENITSNNQRLHLILRLSCVQFDWHHLLFFNQQRMFHWTDRNSTCNVIVFCSHKFLWYSQWGPIVLILKLFLTYHL